MTVFIHVIESLEDNFGHSLKTLERTLKTEELDQVLSTARALDKFHTLFFIL
jgi:hypothetical protein